MSANPATPPATGNGYTVGAADTRPWGNWSVIAAGARFAAKQITVAPGGQLSLQRHQWRDEHWVVVQGTAHVTVGADTRSVPENTALFIPVGAVHRVANKGAADLVIIEVQYGTTLDEADIERLEDVYGRS